MSQPPAAGAPPAEGRESIFLRDQNSVWSSQARLLERASNRPPLPRAERRSSQNCRLTPQSRCRPQAPYLFNDTTGSGCFQIVVRLERLEQNQHYPEAILESELCNAIPTARPAAPITAIIEVVSTPKAHRAAMKMKASKATFIRFLTKPDKVGSAPLRAIRRTTKPVRIVATQRPRTNMARAPMIRGPYNVPH